MVSIQGTNLITHYNGQLSKSNKDVMLLKLKVHRRLIYKISHNNCGMQGYTLKWITITGCNR